MIFLSSIGRDFLNASVIKSGRHSSSDVSFIHGLYVEFIFHNFVEGLLAKKSHTNCAGAL
ncbi:MAG: hypothetical protein U9Q66_04265 [Patescibacteria group bacterium]|nr:hypothetical protein [Patescibacteria group bacterium]